MRRVVLLLGALLAVLAGPRAVGADGSDSSGTHSYTSACAGGLPRFTNTSDPAGTGNGVIEVSAAGATLTLAPGQSGVLDPGQVSPNTQWQVVFFDLGQPYVFDGGSFGSCAGPTTDSLSVVEGCDDGNPVVNFTNTGTGAIHAELGTFARAVSAGATVAAPWPATGTDFDQLVEWHAYEHPDPTGAIGPQIATGTALLANACGATTVIRNIGARPSATVPSAGPAAAAEIASFAVRLTETSIEGLPDDLVAGVVDVTVTDTRGSGPGEVNFSRVEPGTEPAAFAAGLVPVLEGGPFPDYLLNTSGAVGRSMLALDAGEYIVWFEPAQEDVAAADIVTAALTVGPGDDDAMIPPTDGGTIRAGDYDFDAAVPAGGSTVVFTNSSEDQFHHVVLMDFGSNDPALVEEYLPAFLASDGSGPAPAGIDMETVNGEFGYSGVFGPGSSGTFEARFEEGNTYVAMCFISDRDGGLPHALEHQMYEVFRVDTDR